MLKVSLLTSEEKVFLLGAKLSDNGTPRCLWMLQTLILKNLGFTIYGDAHELSRKSRFLTKLDDEL